jgi:hypothetical protein
LLEAKYTVEDIDKIFEDPEERIIARKLLEQILKEKKGTIENKKDILIYGISRKDLKKMN